METMMIARIAVAVLCTLLLVYAATAVAAVLAAIVAGAWRTYARPLWQRRPAPAPALDVARNLDAAATDPAPAVDVARNVHLDELADLMAQASYRLSDADLWAMFDAPDFIPAHERGKR